MRISTHQFFQRGLESVTDLTAQTQRVQQQISSNERLISAADDPVAATRILKLESELDISEQYIRNIDLAENRLQLIEGAVSAIGTTIHRVEELLNSALNGSLTNEDRAYKATEIAERVKELADLVNTRDRDGNYIFAGFAVNDPPFVTAANGYAYQGDEGVREIQISSSAYVTISESGKGLFTDIPVANNHIEVAPAQANIGPVAVTRAEITDQAVYDANYPEDYVISFGNLANVAPAGPNYSIARKSDGVVVQADTAYDAAVGIEFNGFSVGLSGVPAQGDQFVVQSANTNDMLSIVKGIADNIASFSSPSDPDAPSELDAFVADNINNLENIQSALLQGRTRVGARLNSIETIHNTLESSRLSNQEVLRDIRDLDYAEAISNLSFLSFVLEASQQSLVKIAGLSLFNFLR